MSNHFTGLSLGPPLAYPAYVSINNSPPGRSYGRRRVWGSGLSTGPDTGSTARLQRNRQPRA